MTIRDHERLTAHFFRGVNSAQLFERFFSDFGAWEAMGVTLGASNDAIHAAWERLENPRRGEIQEALCEVNDIGRDRGRYVLLDAAERCGIEEFGNLTPQKLAMTLFVDHRRAFETAYAFFMLEKTENLHTLVGDRPAPCKPSDASVQRFKEELSVILARGTEGSRLRVEVEDRHEDKWMAAIPHEEHVAPDHEFDERGRIVTRDRRPVYEMVLIYYPKLGVLKLRVGRGTRKLNLVADAFAEHILERAQGFFARSDIIDFTPLQDPSFAFAALPSDHFERARAVHVSFIRHADPDTVHQMRQGTQAHSSRDVLDTMRDAGLDLSEVEIRSLSISFTFPSGRRRERRTVTLTAPNRMPLDDTDRDRYLEQVLLRWGLIDHEAKRRHASAGVP